MNIVATAHPFNYDEIKAVNRNSDLNTALRNYCSVEIMDCSKQEAVELIKSILDTFDRVIHIGNQEDFEKVRPNMNIVYLHQKIINDKVFQNILRMEPKIIIIRHNMVDYMSNEIFGKLEQLGYPIIFY